MIVGFVAFTMLDYITYGSSPVCYTCWASWRCWVCLIMYCPTRTTSSGQDHYWFFGLMLQLYIVYRLFIYRRHWGCTVGLMVVCIGIQLALGCDNPESEAMNRYRYNFMGGMLPFGFGHTLCPIWREDSDDFPFTTVTNFFGIIFCISIIYSLSGSMMGWTFVPFFICLLSVLVPPNFFQESTGCQASHTGYWNGWAASRPPFSSATLSPERFSSLSAVRETSMQVCSSTSYRASAWLGSSPN